MTASTPMPVRRGLFWFRHDLRVHDNPALLALAADVDEMGCVYIIDPEWFSLNDFGLKTLGTQRYNFLMQSLKSLDDQLQDLGHHLQLYYDRPRSVLSSLVDVNAIDVVGVTSHCGEYERRDEQWLRSQTPSVTCRQATTLFEQHDLPFVLNEMPAVYTPFRKKVEKHSKPGAPLASPVSLPAMMALDGAEAVPSLLSQGQFVGGETAGLDHLRHYFSSSAPAQYKETRNALDTWQDSTKFSPWLANGALSPRQAYAAVEDYEEKVTKNDSTYWIKFELLWREFFHWQARQHQARWFAFDGIQQEMPSSDHDNDVFVAWSEGQTGYEIVDACMRQLNRTGYMSNRGRQLVASCFVHELGQDWRYGAAYFEQQLIDFDVASNWGNWLYLAGVGSDPRGHRQFNLQKQAERYDPDGHFIQKWLA